MTGKKKILSIIMSLCMAASLYACGGGTSASGSVSTSESVSKSVETSVSKEEVKESVTANRTIMAEELKGTVTAYTETESYAVVAGEKLESGRYLKTESSSDLTMLLDADKHVYAGNETRLHLTADGKKGSTKTRIELYEGTLVTGIDEKLGDDETFEINTPNATMAVRGTVFTVKVELQEDHSFSTVLTVDQGAVETVTVENGEEKTVTVGEGESVEFKGASTEPPESTLDLALLGFADFRTLSVDDRFEYYKKTDGLFMEHYWGDDDSQIRYQILTGTIYRTADYFHDELVAEAKNRGLEGIDDWNPIYMILFDEPQEVSHNSDGTKYEYMIAGGEYEGFISSSDDFPVGTRIEVCALLETVYSLGQKPDSGYLWLEPNVYLFGYEQGPECAIFDYRIPGSGNAGPEPYGELMLAGPEVKIYKVGNDKLAFCFEGEACEDFVVYDGNLTRGSVFKIEFDDGKKLYMNQGHFFLELADGKELKANSGSDLPICGHNLCYAELNYPGVCGCFDGSEGTARFYLDAADDDNSRYTLLGERLAPLIISPVSEGNFQSVKRNLLDRADMHYKAQAPWSGSYRATEGGTGAINVEILSGGLVHFQLDIPGKSGDYYCMEEDYAKENIDGVMATRAICDLCEYDPAMVCNFQDINGHDEILYFDEDGNNIWFRK